MDLHQFKTPSTVQTGEPQYSVLLTLKWDIFIGFKRLNDMRRAEADREVARAHLMTLEVEAISQVWRAYYEFESSLRKYDYAESLLAASEESYDANLETYRQGLVRSSNFSRPSATSRTRAIPSFRVRQNY